MMFAMLLLPACDILQHTTIDIARVMPLFVAATPLFSIYSARCSCCCRRRHIAILPLCLRHDITRSPPDTPCSFMPYSLSLLIDAASALCLPRRCRHAILCYVVCVTRYDAAMPMLPPRCHVMRKYAYAITRYLRPPCHMFLRYARGDTRLRAQDDCCFCAHDAD